MAKKRLNKKVALIGSVVLVLLVLAAIVVILYLSRDPEKFIRDGDAAVEAAREAIDKQIRQEQYKTAEDNYHKARGLAKTDSLKKEMLFKLVDVYLETNRWRNALGCWNNIIQIDPENLKARFGQLNYFYIMADSGIVQVWQEVASQASEFIEVVENAGLLMEETAEWEPFGMQEAKTGGRRIGPYLYLLRGRATLGMVRLGGMPDPDESLERAVGDLEKVRKLESDNVDACWHLAQAIVTKGEILAGRGVLEERDKAGDSALEVLEQAVKVAGDDPRAHVNLLSMKLILARRSDAGARQQQIQSLEPKYLSLVQKFPSSAQAHSALAGFYAQLGPESLDKAVVAAEEAIRLDRKNVGYARNAANLHYRRFSIYGQKQEIHKAIELAKNALTLPDAEDEPGPRQWANRRNRISLYLFLANCYIEQVLEPCEVRTETQQREWLADAEQTVDEIQLLFGLGDAPAVVKWRGMLDLAKGNRDAAIKKLYSAYEQIKASRSPEQGDAQLAYALAKVFKNTSEVGAVREFLESALSARIELTKPEALLDYADVLLRLGGFNAALSVVNSFEDRYWANARSQMLRVRAYIGANEFDKAEEELARTGPDDPNAIKLRLALARAKIRQLQRAIAQRQIRESAPVIFREMPGEVELETADGLTTKLKVYNDTLAEYMGRLISVGPNSVGEASFAAVCDSYITEGQTSKARDLVSSFLGVFPDNIAAMAYKQILSEPEPGEVSQERRKEIEEQALSNVADPLRRAMNLGAFYQRHNEPEKAVAEWKKVLGSRLRGNENVPAAEAGDGEMTDSQRVAADYLFQIAVGMKDWELAGQVAELAQRENIDSCGGQFFAARLAVTEERYEDALAKLDECLRQRPVFSRGFMLRSSVNASLGNEHASIEDAQRATSLNPLDGATARVLAKVLYQRNQRLGDNVSSHQITEARAAFDRAVALNPRDLVLRSDYAEYIIPTEPLRALAIRQNLQKTAPTLQNAVLLGRLATRVAMGEVNLERKEALFAVAAWSFEQARKMNPQDKNMLLSYAEYYRVKGQDEKAEQLLVESRDQKLLWGHYLRSGKFEGAKEVLERLYQSEAKDSDVIRGLLVIAERTIDKEAAKKYSQELLLLEDSVDNNLIQVQTFLKVGLVKEAEYKLQSFREKYPDEPRAMLLGAWLAMKQGELRKALELTNQNLESERDNAIAWRLRGQINLLMANYDQAIIDLKRSRSLFDEPVTRISLAKAYRRAGRVEEAITELEGTIDYPQAPAEGRELLEQIYLQFGRRAALKRLYDETLERFPGNVLWCNRAGAFAITAAEFRRAEQLYKQAWEESKKNGEGDADAFSGYLQALVLGEKLDKVFEEAQGYVDGDFAPIAFCRMAEAKMKLGDKDGATQYCRKAIDKAGADEILASDILQEMYSLLEPEELMRHCKEKVEADPDSLTANWSMFSLTKLNGEYNRAVGYIDKCLQITGPDSPRKLNYTVEKVKVLQLAYYKTADSDYLGRAIAEYESLLTKMPNNMNVWNNFAYLLAENNERLSDALRFAKRAHTTRPNNADFLDTYSYALYKNDRFSEADKFLQAALQQYASRPALEGGTPPEVYEHLGMIKEALGTQAEALSAYKQALEMGPGKLAEPVIERIRKAIERLSQEVETAS